MIAPVCILDSVVVLHCIVFDFSEGLRFETSGASGNGGGLERPLLLSLPIDLAPCLVPARTHVSSVWGPCRLVEFLARWLTSARAYRIGGRKLCPSVCLYVKRYLLLQFCTDYNQTWINMIWAVAAKTLLCQIFHKRRKIEVNCVYISRCAQLVSYFWNAGMHTK